MNTVKWLALIVLLTLSAFALQAEPQCPGNVASLRFRVVERSQIVVPVTVNRMGPYDFLVDTGAQVTTVDPALAGELHLNIQGTTGVVTVGARSRVSFAELDSLAAGSRSQAKVLVVVQKMESLQAADPRIRGILGGNFLRHFDVLLDYGNKMICLDDAKVMQQKVKGQHIALVSAPRSEHDAFSTEPLTARAQLSGITNRQVLLLLDSGTNVPFLYHADKFSTHESVASEQLHSRGADGAERVFAVSAPQNLEIGKLMFHQIRFVTRAQADDDGTKVAVDGMLPTGIFRSVYISYADRFIVLEPW